MHACVDPGQNTTDSGVNPRFVFFTTASSPAGNPHQVKATLSLAYQRSTTVTLEKYTWLAEMLLQSLLDGQIHAYLFDFC